ncbi:hypothetical protein SLEP1_g6971 [Rubroshorea leprosula]|uniref:Phosphoinositide phospholipase C n=1 Tax=Rubroshorea leprosula TaxID=152421 RepID=A0AAV5I569_9ROSI|nr:hypothetical protein SLEP1_g6971 [Rubroshorea leprosula]
MDIIKLNFKVFCCWKRRFKLRMAEPPQELKNVFVNYSHNGTMTIDDLRSFLVRYQGETNATREDAQAIFDSLKHLNIFQRRGLHLEAFVRYLLGDLNIPLSSSLGVHHDMNAPLAHYFIYTGHNSYLTGNQINSACSADPIAKALQRGVRVIELDLWPNSNGKNVEVRHGGALSMTSPVELDKCLVAIKENAFLASEYPVVITFEDHLTPSLQSNVAKLVTKIFGDMLYKTGSEYLTEFPSPECLKRKVLISTKPPKEYLESHRRRERSEEWEAEMDEEEIPEKTEEDYEAQTSKKEQAEGREHDPDEDEDKTTQEYRHLIAIHAGKTKGELLDWLKDDPRKVRRLSLSEQELENATRKHGSAVVRFTQRNLLRIFPKGTRFDSSNYCPFIGWMHGAQMVAFNMQGHGKHLWAMQGMFKANGGCGYVKKPDFLLDRGPSNEVFNPSEALPVKTVLRVKIYLGEGWHVDFHHADFDRYSPPDFFARVGISGAPADQRMERTLAIEDEWLPVWNQDFGFPLTVPELAVLRIEVLEYDTTKRPDFAGQTCLPVSELKTGIRAVPLHDRKGDKYKHARLLMRFGFETPFCY